MTFSSFSFSFFSSSSHFSPRFHTSALVILMLVVMVTATAKSEQVFVGHLETIFIASPSKKHIIGEFVEKLKFSCHLWNIFRSANIFFFFFYRYLIRADENVWEKVRLAIYKFKTFDSTLEKSPQKKSQKSQKVEKSSLKQSWQMLQGKLWNDQFSFCDYGIYCWLDDEAFCFICACG